MARRVIRRRSRRAAVLLLFGAIFVAIGGSYLGIEQQITAGAVAAQSYRAHLQVMPLDGWAYLFIGAGVTSVTSAAAGLQTVGFAALMGISSCWGLMFVASYVSTGYERALIGALTWSLIVGILAIVAGWPDAPTRLDALPFDLGPPPC